ncbi:MAG: hypothetical protein V3V41_05320 [Candidatus Heimdallarchaeota archaeon]
MSEKRKDNETDPVLDHLFEEIKEEKKNKHESEKRVKELLAKFHLTKRNKERAEIIDQVSEFIQFPEIISLLQEVALNDTYAFCRAKAVSYLAELVEEEEVKRTIIKKLNDSSPKVRLWSVWGLRVVIHEEEVLEILLRRLRYLEKANRVKLWLIRTLSDQISNDDVMTAFFKLLESKPNTETRKLLLYYLLQRLDNPEISYKLANYVLKETNKDIKSEIIKKLLTLDNEDVEYSLNKLSRMEKDENILALLQGNH